jgi:RNA polymerase sigma-70 factor (ECF subfamily)
VVLLAVLALALEEDPPPDVLAERIKDGDRAAFRTFFERHHGRLFGYLCSRGLDAATAEDLVQKAFLYVWEHRAEIDPDQSLRAYLFRIGYTRALNHHRNASRTEPEATLDDTPGTQAPPDEETINAELRSALDNAIAALPDRRRAVFELCFLRDFTYREAATALDIRPRTVETHMRLALRDLREALSELE